MGYCRVLILSPHTDDGELGAGGTIARFVDEGKDVYYVAFSGCETSLPKELPKNTLIKECKDACGVLGIQPENITLLNYQVRTFTAHRQEILDSLIQIQREIKPELVLVPASTDMHQDHGIIYSEALRAFKKSASIWGYEQPWNNLTFTTDVFVKLRAKHIHRKLTALKQYESQSKRSYMSERNLRALMNVHGSQIDTKYAEAFELARMIYDDNMFSSRKTTT